MGLEFFNAKMGSSSVLEPVMFTSDVEQRKQR